MTDEPDGLGPLGDIIAQKLRPEVTDLSPEQEQQFAQWVKDSGIHDVDHPDSHYDYRGLFRDTEGKVVPKKAGRHFPDTYKQHGHPTFSVESKYSTGPNDGGRWYDGDVFMPGSK